MRIKNIVLGKLINNKLIQFAKLEDAMNSNDGIDSATSECKIALEKLVILDLMIDKWREIIKSGETEQKRAQIK